MSSDSEAFVAEIAAHPDDDAPRLIYADWLEERGDPQGQFIRVQCELAGNPTPERRQDLLCLERELLARHRDQWLLPLEGALIRGVFHRGVLDQVEVEPQKFIERADDWFRLFPLKILQLNVRGSPLEKLATIASLRQIRQLERIRSLRLSNSELGDDDCIRLLSADNIGPLEELWLTSTGVKATALRWLASSSLARTLQVLILSGNELGDDGRDVLCKGPRFPELRWLYLTGCRIGGRSAQGIQNRHPNLVGGFF
jgi:uncharacterized protein (TIGR02996 family)